MTITPLAPRTPYIAVPAGSCTTSIDAISREIDGPETGAVCDVDRHVVDHTQRLVVRHEGADPVDANGEAAVGHFRYGHAGKAVAQELRERAAGRALALFRRHDGVWNRARWRDPVGPALTRGVFLVGAADGEAEQQPEQPVGVS